MASTHDGLFPQSQSDLVVALNNFASVIESAPDAVGVSAGDAAMLVQLAGEFDHAMQVIGVPDTKTADNIARKDAARDKALKAFRLTAGLIKANPNVSVEVKQLLGMRVDGDDLTGRSRPKKRIEAPTTWPILNITAGFPGYHVLAYADSTHPERKAKPLGVLQLQLYVAMAETGEPTIIEVSKAAFLQNVTRTPFKVHFTPEQNGRMVTYFGRWCTRTGLTGPWSSPVSMTATAVV